MSVSGQRDDAMQLLVTAVTYTHTHSPTDNRHLLAALHFRLNIYGRRAFSIARTLSGYPDVQYRLFQRIYTKLGTHNSGPVFPIPGFGIGDSVIMGSRRDYD